MEEGPVIRFSPLDDDAPAWAARDGVFVAEVWPRPETTEDLKRAIALLKITDAPQ